MSNTQHSTFRPSWLIGYLLCFLILLSGCDVTPPKNDATLMFSLDAHPAATINPKMLSPKSLHSNAAKITSLTLTINSDESDLLLTRTIASGDSTLITVPAQTSLNISGDAYIGEILSYKGGVTIEPLPPGTSKKVSFLMYSVSGEPVQVDIALENKPTNGSSTGNSFSLSQNYVLFTSSASNLVENDNNEISDIFLRDLNSENIRNLHADSQGALANNNGTTEIADASISADGRYVVFSSSANNLVTNDDNDVSDVFLKDTLTGKTQRISLKNDGTQATQTSNRANISNDGKTILFYSADDLLGTGGNRLYLYDRITQTLENSLENTLNPNLSGDGNSIVYVNSQDRSLSLYNLAAEDTLPVVVSSGNNNVTWEYAINTTGRYIVFVSDTTTDTVQAGQVYRFDSATLTTARLVSLSPNIIPRHLSINDDGRYIVFQFNESIYVYSIDANLLEKVTSGNTPFLSLDGTRIGYTDDNGRLLLKNNPLFAGVSSSPSLGRLAPASLSASLNDNNDGITLSWLPVADAIYYRAYISTEPGITTTNYFQKLNGRQIETLGTEISIPFDLRNVSTIYASVTTLNNQGESTLSNEFQLILPFVITSRTPSNDAANTPIDVKPTILFNQDLQQDSITGTSFSLIELENNSPIAGSFQFPDKRTLVFEPTETLNFNTAYEIHLSESITNETGINLPSSETISFVTAQESINFFNISVNANEGGTVSPSTIQTVREGTQVEFTITPTLGYFIDSLSGCEGVQTNEIYTTTPVSSDCTVSVNFTKKPYQLTYSANENGSIVGQNTQTILHGENGSSITAVPATGYNFVNWSDESTENPRTDLNVTNNLTVTANFARITHTLNYTAGENGSLTGTTSQTIFAGNNGSPITAVPTTGYRFTRWSDDSTENPRTETNVSTNITVTANFTRISYTLTYSSGDNGSVIGNTSQNVNSGNNGTAVEAIPASGYLFVNWSDGATNNPRTDLTVSNNISVSASFSRTLYTLTYVAGENGDIEGNASQTVAAGNNGSAVTAVPATGYRFTRWSDDSAANPRTDVNVSSNVAVTANFTRRTYTLTYNAGNNGSLTGNTSQLVRLGDNGTAVLAIPDADFFFESWSDGSTNNPRTDLIVSDNIAVTANFDRITYTLNYSAENNGNITGNASQTVAAGSSGSPVTAAPVTGYRFTRWSDNSSENPRTETNVSSNIAVTASFTRRTYTLTYTADNNGSLIGDTSQRVRFRNDGTVVEAIPASGYFFVNWSDGSTNNPRTDLNISGNITVSASFAQVIYTLNYSAGNNGNITGNASQTISAGGNGSPVTATPEAGYQFASWSDDSTANPRTDINVSNNIEVTASFTALPSYELTYSAGPNGILTGQTFQSVNSGGNGSTITAIPNPEYVFVSWNDGSTNNPRADFNVTQNITVTANFALTTYSLTYTAGSNGTLTGAASQSVSSGGDGTPVTAIPNEGYVFVDWSDGSTSNPRTDSNVLADITMTANFQVNTYIVGINLTLGGAISPQAQSVTIDHGQIMSFTVIPDNNYQIESIAGCGGSLNQDTYITQTITSDCEINVNFSSTDIPIFTSSPSLSIIEGATDVGNVIATISNGDDIFYGIVGGVDSSFFTIDPTTGLLSFANPPFLNLPLDNNEDNIYQVNIIANTDIVSSQPFSITVEVIPTVISPLTLNDTGATQCSNTINFAQCQTGLFPGQDAVSGRDFTTNNPLDGSAGFSFTRITDINNQIADACVADNVTGLTWESMGDGTTPRIYTWSDAQLVVQTANETSLCGYRDWRLPTLTELLSLVDYGKINPAIDRNYFPNAAFYFPAYYLSSTGKANDRSSVWAIELSNGSTTQIRRDFGAYIRLVRATNNR